MSSLSSGQRLLVDVQRNRGIRNVLHVHAQEQSSSEFSPNGVIEGGKSLATGIASPWVTSRVRRCMEMSISAAALLVLSPVMLGVAALIKISSPGSVLFRQRRMGKHGNEFTLYKFRSMYEEKNVPGSPITVEGDSRITPIGGFLRRCKLDELPQFWNVLKGDMSLVGPRPKLPHHEGLHLPCRPGITGVATLAFRDEEKILKDIPKHKLDHFYDQVIKPVKAHLDLNYIETATLLTDFQILLRTAALYAGNEEALAIHVHEGSLNQALSEDSYQSSEG